MKVFPADQYANDTRARAIAEVSSRLNELRENWLNPPNLVQHEPEVAAGYPERVLNDDAADILRQRTLTNLYNERTRALLGAAAERSPAKAARDTALIRLMFDLGLRHGEVVGLA
jgi:integrase